MPTLAGKYELDRRLGSGGMAEVFLGRVVGKDGFSRPVAIKRVLAHLAHDDAFVKMFVAEAQMCAKLQHPNIVSVLDFDRDDDGRPFLVIELVDGPSLAELANDRALATESAIYVATELLRGLAYAHDLPNGEAGVQGIVHRDISPHNVLLSWEGAVKLSDFGIAKARAASGVTASELLKGKPAYMSPEQANGEALDRRSDLFSVGIVLWELLVGRSLFSGNTTQETLARVLFAPVPSPRSIRADVPGDVDAVVMKLLARERNDRFANAGDAIATLIACKDSPRDGRGRLVAELADFRRGAPQHAEQAPTVRTHAQPLPSPRDAARPTQSRARALLLALGALVLISVAVATTVVVLERREPSTPPAPQPVVALVDPLAVDGNTIADATIADVMIPMPPSVDARTDSPHAFDARVTRARLADAGAHHETASDPEPISDEPTPEDAGAVSQASVRAAARKKMFDDQWGYGGWVNFPISTLKGVKPEEVYKLARREAERLFGKVEDGDVTWSAIQPDGTVDTAAHPLSVIFAAVEPEDSARCFTVKVWPDEAKSSLENQECRRGFRPRCTAGQLHRRAVALGVPATMTIGTNLAGANWKVWRWGNDSERLLISNDCY